MHYRQSWIACSINRIIKPTPPRRVRFDVDINSAVLMLLFVFRVGKALLIP